MNADSKYLVNFDEHAKSKPITYMSHDGYVLVSLVGLPVTPLPDQLNKSYTG